MQPEKADLSRIVNSTTAAYLQLVGVSALTSQAGRSAVSSDLGI